MSLLFRSPKTRPLYSLVNVNSSCYIKTVNFLCSSVTCFVHKCMKALIQVPVTPSDFTWFQEHIGASSHRSWRFFKPTRAWTQAHTHTRFCDPKECVLFVVGFSNRVPNIIHMNYPIFERDIICFSVADTAFCFINVLVSFTITVSSSYT
jgi:hypothetical protein